MQAVIYTRVSTVEQAANLSLPVQEEACRRYCEEQGWKVAKVFVERGESAKTADRTELRAMMAFCRERPKVGMVVVYTLDRLSRNSFDHYAIRAYLAKVGVELRCVTQPIDESPTGRLMEGILAAMAQFDNDLRSQKTRAGMVEALRRGRWVFQAPIGYLSERGLKPHPTHAPLVTAGFERVAFGMPQAEALDKANHDGLRTFRGKPVSRQTWSRALGNRVYIGRVVVPSWGIDVVGEHEPIVPEAVFYRVQRQMTEASPRKANHPDFPLRRFVQCHCGKPLTASWSTGKRKKYPYYRCTAGHVNVRRGVLEHQFLELLDSLTPDPAKVERLRELVMAAWERRHGEAEAARKALLAEVAAIERKRESLLDAHVYRQAIDEATFKAETARLAEAEAVARMSLEEHGRGSLNIEAALAHATTVLLQARPLWERLSLEGRRKFQEVVFPEGLRYDGSGFGTPLTCSIFKHLQADSDSEKGVVTLAGAPWNTLLAELVAIAEVR